MVEQAKTTEGKVVDLDVYKFYTPEDPKAAKEMEAKPWNHRKLEKNVVQENILSYQEVLEMAFIMKNSYEQKLTEMERMEEEKKALIKSTEMAKKEWDRWEGEVKLIEKDIPEIAEIVKKERADDAKTKAQHEANLKGEGKGRAFEMTEKGEMVDKTGTKK